ncbi:MAG: hypothetical protein ABS999_12390, partial [Pseudomonas atacamensis]|uniref:hypothetical protein n=1 Tax=Pseudomonas atacamensis TaxID=2565368 RepID=UPI0033160809
PQRRNPSLRGPNVGASVLGYLFAGPALRRLKKVTRRKGGTVISNTHSKDIHPKPQVMVGPKAATTKKLNPPDEP